MGMPSSLETRYRLAIPHTPPELVSPDSLPPSSRQSEDRPWNPVAPVSPPMSNYDPTTKTEMSSGNGSDQTPAREEHPEAAPRTQLPSLSSLFGPPQARPLHSPTPDRSGAYTPGSYGSTILDRSVSSSSYFPLTSGPAIPQSRTVYDSRQEDRTPIPSLPRQFLGPLSPRPREQEQTRPEPRSDYSQGRWPAPHETARSPFHSPQDRLPPSLPSTRREDDYANSYAEQRTSQLQQQILPSTPSSVANADVIPVKDGLGPKIWTGTHFLPRFVRSAEVPGEGLCYFYDDGSHCKSVIDGEVVNAHWGVTKAGKPRKRLAIACITCREKKIKCDPDYPRCVQCEKFGRVCKFKNAPRGGQNTSPSTPPAELDDTRRLEPMSRPPPVQTPHSSHSRDSVSPRTTIRPGSPLDSGIPVKRLRMGLDYLPPPMGLHSPVPVPSPDTWRSGPTSSFPWPQPERPRIREDVLCRAWQTDPYVSNPPSVVSTVSSFFAHANGTALCFLPGVVINSWVQSAHRKSPEDLMLVYSILAMGATLAGGSPNIAIEYAQVARYATDRARLTLQLVQAKLLLALFYLAISRPSEANDMLSGAVSAATWLELNLELDKSQERGKEVFPYGLERIGYAEVRRRTFWACFLLERLSGLFPTRVAIINTEDIFIRLPADVARFEEQVEVVTPGFEPNFSLAQYKNADAGTMGYLVQIVTIFGDVMASIYRNSHRSTSSDFDFSNFYHHIASRLEDWHACVPRHMAFSPANLETAGSDRGSFILMHLTYRLTLIKLHRHVHPQFLTSTTRYQYASVAREHAAKLLEVVCAVARDRGSMSSILPPPFTSFAILEATDVLSSEGSMAALPALVDSLALARSVLELLGTVWEDAKVHKMAMDHRLDKLSTLRDDFATHTVETSTPIPGIQVFLNKEEDPEKKLAAGQCWQISSALETRFPSQMDSIYASITRLSL